MDRKALGGILLILAGVLMFAGKGNPIDPGFVFGNFWASLFIIPLGLFFHWLYFFATGRKGTGLLIPGGTLLVAGVVCQVSMLFDIWEYTWPGFPLAVAFGLLEFYWFSGRNRWLLIPIFILTSVSVLFFAIFALGGLTSFHVMGQSAAAIVLIAAGLFLMLGKKRERF
ncbi:hypothetical protein [Paenibacillus mesotrionivorans]|uniref:Uncharacterized protein n=1 Tax=Paenibacillus mesotrionivorans TaxID=3160968 RepID=A0ACC7P5A2_9BACL